MMILSHPHFLTQTPLALPTWPAPLVGCNGCRSDVTGAAGRGVRDVSYLLLDNRKDMLERDRP
jgi:hypothetical protein